MERFIKRLAVGAVVMTFTVSTSVLAGWVWSISALKSVLPGLVTMKVNTALGFLLCSVGLTALLQTVRNVTPRSTARRVLGIAATGLLLIGGATLFEYASGIDLHIDRLLYDPSIDGGGQIPGRMAPITALCFWLLGSALLCSHLRSQHSLQPTEWLALPVILVGLISLLGYFYGVETLYRVPGFTAVALHTAASFVVTGIGLLAAHPEFRIRQQLLGADTGGLLLRRLLPAALLLAPLLGYACLAGQRAGYYGTEFGLSLVAGLLVIVFSMLVWMTSGSVRRNVERRERAERSLHDSALSFGQVLNSASEAIITLDRNYRIVFFNEAAQVIFGRSAGEVIAHPLTLLLPSFTPADAAQQSRTRHLMIGRHRDGTDVPLEASISCSTINDTPSFAIILRDISERLRQQETLARYTKRLEGLIELDCAILSASSPEQIAATAVKKLADFVPFWTAGVTLFDEAHNGRLLAVARAEASEWKVGGTPIPLAEYGIEDFERLQTGQVCGPRNLVPAAQYANSIRFAYDRALRSYFRVPLIVEGRLLGSLGAGSDRPDHFTAEHIEIAKAFAGPIAIALQQSLLREKIKAYSESLQSKVEERTHELQDANLQLAAVNRELEAFSASASHDLRSPLTQIAGLTGLLRHELGPLINEKAQRRFQRIDVAVTRMADVIDGLLSLAHLSRHDDESRTVNVRELVMAVTQDVRQQYPTHDVRFDLDCNAHLHADARLLKIVFSNLLSNAWKYSTRTAQPHVQLRCEKVEGRWRFEISDNGAGFDMQYAEKLFQPFQRMHSYEEFPGIGIGLATVQRIVQRYGGVIEARSALNQGATFSFTLPDAEVPASDAHPVRQAAMTAEHGEENIE